MEYIAAFAEDTVPSTGELDPYMHVFVISAVTGLPNSL
jgi:hypothetical protein